MTTGARILIVEDEAIVARDIHRQLTALGYDPVGIAASGGEAIALAASSDPQLVLMDIHLVGPIDGIDAALAIRQRSMTPIVFLTAYTTDDVVARAKVAEPAGYIVKPFDEFELRTTIEIALYNDGLSRRVHLQSAALNAAANAIVITGRDGTIQWVNPAFTTLTGYSEAEALGANPRDLVKSGAHPPKFYQRMWLTLLAGHVWEGEIINRRKDGSHYFEEQTITPVRTTAGEITNFVAIKRDLTEQKRLQAQFLQAQKMEVVGRLAGGVAHDFNNLLTVINGTADLALMDLPADHPLREDFGHIQDAGNRAAQITRQLLSFSRKQILAPAVVNLSTSVAGMAGLLRRLIGEDIDLAIIAPPTVENVVVDPGQLEQVLLNLAVNARDAMPNGGSLTIETGNVTLDEAFTLDHVGAAVGPHVMLVVTDTGTGMTDEVRRHIFEPFFTTKELGRGTGLGLATVQSIVTQSRGCVAVESRLGHGASFRVYLPAVTGAAASPSAGPTKPAPGTETILLVEDEEGLREFVARALRIVGYTVLTANGAKQAMELLKSHNHEVCLVFTDVVMPGMTGVEMAALITATYPDLKVLFSSGYSEDARLGQVGLAGTANFLAKPYTIAGLTGKIRAVLDAQVAS